MGFAVLGALSLLEGRRARLLHLAVAASAATFAAFLISVQAEMDKVSWSTWPELWRATVVVVGTMFLLGATLFVYDQVLVFVFKYLGILQV